MRDTLRQYVELRRALVMERTKLKERLTGIAKALSGAVPEVRSPPPSKPARKPGRKLRRKPRSKAAVAPPTKKPVRAEAGPSGEKKAPPAGRALSLKAAVLRVTGKESLTKQEILSAIDKLGYRFTTEQPMRCLDNVLYTKGLFSKANGRFRALQGGQVIHENPGGRLR